MSIIWPGFLKCNVCGLMIGLGQTCPNCWCNVENIISACNSLCTSGAPAQFRVSIPAMSNGSCSNCAASAGLYYADFCGSVITGGALACAWIKHISPFCPTCSDFDDYQLGTENNTFDMVLVRLDMQSASPVAGVTNIFISATIEHYQENCNLPPYGFGYNASPFMSWSYDWQVNGLMKWEEAFSCLDNGSLDGLTLTKASPTSGTKISSCGGGEFNPNFDYHCESNGGSVTISPEY